MLLLLFLTVLPLTWTHSNESRPKPNRGMNWKKCTNPLCKKLGGTCYNPLSTPDDCTMTEEMECLSGDPCQCCLSCDSCNSGLCGSVDGVCRPMCQCESNERPDPFYPCGSSACTCCREVVCEASMSCTDMGIDGVCLVPPVEDGITATHYIPDAPIECSGEDCQCYIHCDEASSSDCRNNNYECFPTCPPGMSQKEPSCISNKCMCCGVDEM
ncbi:hypothetical protein Pmani_030577 [Petrolisthes manimaculis]|uniref:Uncharacterized protein n=1 Tax=Petrolisthes manimaculis TaxID=1843537 RepID=A0AAE1TSR5_9EUCA|nr:hypothetical protein Pmani_030577 [Petrolisthes manimaculis]